MTDEAKPPKKKPTGGTRRPRKPAADAAKQPRSSAAKAAPEAAAGPAAAGAAVDGAAAAAPGDAPTEVVPADDAPTEVVTAEDAPTEVVAADGTAADDAATEVVAADAAATQVIAEDAAVTQVAPSAGGPASPPPPAPPFAPVPRTLTPSGGGDRRTTVWAVLAVASVAILALVLLWAFVLRDGGEQFVGSWAPVSGEGGGLVITSQDGDFEVAMYDTDLELTGTYPAAQDGDALTFKFTDTQSQLGMVEARLTHDEERDILTLRLSAMGQEGAPLEFARVDALEAGPTRAMPVITPTPTASPSASPSGSPSPTPSPTGTDTAQYDEQVAAAIVQIQVGVLNWATDNGGYPPVEQVTADAGVGQYVTPWPTNPFTGQPMVAGDQPGDYTYEQLEGGQAYRITGHLANGLPYTVP